MAARRNGIVPRAITLLAIPSLLTTGVGANCNQAGQVEFFYPTDGLTLHYLDRIEVEYRSNIANPILSCWCDSGTARQQFAILSPSFNSSESVLLNFVSSGPCWFELVSGIGGACGGKSSNFTLISSTRSPGDLKRDVTTSSATSLAASSTSSPTTSSTSSASVTNTAVASTGDADSDGGASLSLGARAGLAIAIVGAGVLAGAMVALFYFRRRKREQESENLAGAIVNHERRSGRRGFEKWMSRQDSSSTSSARVLRSTRSQQPIVEAVFDGFPGSTGYDDVRPLHSGDWAAPSPSSSNPSEWYETERSRTRDELTAARLNSSPLIVSYGPNPVTPTLRNGARVAGIARQDSWRSDAISTDSRENIPAIPTGPVLNNMPSYNNFPNYDYTLAPVAAPVAAPSPPKQTAPIIVTSYGPNKVTPTPVIKSPTVPPDESVLRMKGFASRSAMPQEAEPIRTRQRQFSFETDDDFDLGALGLGAADATGPMAPLPPYASSAEFEAMEKGAIKKLPEPQAQAELPPTKDGYYHTGTDISETFELSSDPALRHPPFRGGAGGALRDIDEQKVLLPESEMAYLREQKARIRAQQQKERQQEMGGESIEMTSGPSFVSNDRRR